MSKIHHFYYDTTLYRILCRKDNDEFFKMFTNTVLDLHIPYNQTYLDSRTIFTWYAFLEAIGEGRFKEKYPEHRFKLPKDFMEGFDLCQNGQHPIENEKKKN